MRNPSRGSSGIKDNFLKITREYLNKFNPFSTAEELRGSALRIKNERDAGSIDSDNATQLSNLKNALLKR